MTTNPATPSGPTNPELAPKPKKAATPKVKVTPNTKPAKKAATPKAAKVIVTDKGWEVALTHSQAHVAYRKQRTLLHGAGPEAYRKAAAKALDISDEAFLAAFYAEAKAQPEGK